MKIQHQEIQRSDNSKRIRTLFATSMEELEILYALTQKGLAIFPKVSETAKAHERLTTMNRSFQRALSHWEEIEQVPVSETYQDAINVLSIAIEALNGKPFSDPDTRRKEYYVDAIDLLRKARAKNLTPVK